MVMSTILNNEILADEDKIFKKDVKTMSYEDLMAAVRYLHEQRQNLSENLEDDNQNSANSNESNRKFSHKRAA